MAEEEANGRLHNQMIEDLLTAEVHFSRKKAPPDAAKPTQTTHLLRADAHGVHAALLEAESIKSRDSDPEKSQLYQNAQFMQQMEHASAIADVSKLALSDAASSSASVPALFANAQQPQPSANFSKSFLSRYPDIARLLTPIPPITYFAAPRMQIPLPEDISRKRGREGEPSPSIGVQATLIEPVKKPKPSSLPMDSSSSSSSSRAKSKLGKYVDDEDEDDDMDGHDYEQDNRPAKGSNVSPPSLPGFKSAKHAAAPSSKPVASSSSSSSYKAHIEGSSAPKNFLVNTLTEELGPPKKQQTFKSPFAIKDKESAQQPEASKSAVPVGAKKGAKETKEGALGSGATISEDMMSKHELMQEIYPGGMVPDCMAGVDPAFALDICNELLIVRDPVTWDDVAGLVAAKESLMDAIVYPNMRPDIFNGDRAPEKGVLLFGPPGTGKTLIARAIASQIKSKFFSMSSATLMSKWVGEGEKKVKALFAVARAVQPAVIFIDEVDSILGARKEDESEASRRLKTEFLTATEGAGSSKSDRILFVAATNLPWSIDEAVRRRLPLRLYVPLPDKEGRIEYLRRRIGKSTTKIQISDAEIDIIAKKSAGFSGSDLGDLFSAAMKGPLKEIDIINTRVEDIRPVLLRDFEAALGKTKATVLQDDLSRFEGWNNDFGAHGSKGSA